MSTAIDRSFEQNLSECRRTARLGLLLSLAAALYVVEAQLPALPLPGARLGLANLVSILVLYVWGVREALLIATLRQILGGIFTGGLFGPPFLFGLAGAFLSVFVMGVLLEATGRRVGPVIISMAGAVAHNMAQLAIAYALVRQMAVFAYLPYLLLFALPAGAAVGYLARLLLPLLREECSVDEARSAHPSWLRVVASAGVVVLLAAGLAGGARLHWAGATAMTSEDLYVRISVDGQELNRLPLSEQTTYEVPLARGYVKVAVSEGKASVAQADCPDQICVSTGAISRPGQAVICVPYRVVVEVIGGKAWADVDAVTW